MNWFPRQSAWEHQQELAQKRRERARHSIEAMSSLAASLSTARDNALSGQAELAAKLALARLKKKV